jgi:hypothetical protein
MKGYISTWDNTLSFGLFSSCFSNKSYGSCIFLDPILETERPSRRRAHAAQENRLHYVGRHLCACKQGTMLAPVRGNMSLLIACLVPWRKQVACANLSLPPPKYSILSLRYETLKETSVPDCRCQQPASKDSLQHFKLPPTASVSKLQAYFTSNRWIVPL